jgi:hypothetical protein
MNHRRLSVLACLFSAQTGSRSTTPQAKWIARLSRLCSANLSIGLQLEQNRNPTSRADIVTVDNRSCGGATPRRAFYTRFKRLV